MNEFCSVCNKSKANKNSGMCSNCTILKNKELRYNENLKEQSKFQLLLQEYNEKYWKVGYRHCKVCETRIHLNALLFESQSKDCAITSMRVCGDSKSFISAHFHSCCCYCSINCYLEKFSRKDINKCVILIDDNNGRASHTFLLDKIYERNPVIINNKCLYREDCLNISHLINKDSLEYRYNNFKKLVDNEDYIYRVENILREVYFNEIAKYIYDNDFDNAMKTISIIKNIKLPAYNLREEKNNHNSDDKSNSILNAFPSKKYNRKTY